MCGDLQEPRCLHHDDDVATNASKTHITRGLGENKCMLLTCVIDAAAAAKVMWPCE